MLTYKQKGATTWWFRSSPRHQKLLTPSSSHLSHSGRPPLRVGHARPLKAASLEGHQAAHQGCASPDSPDDEVHQHRAAHHHQHGQGPLGHGLFAWVGAHSEDATHGAFFPRLPRWVIRCKRRPGAAAIAALCTPRPRGFSRSAARGLGGGGAGRQGGQRPGPVIGRS